MYYIATELFVDKLFSNEERIPTFLWNNNDLFRRLHEVYRECDNSIVSLARELKRVLSQYFSKPGKNHKSTCLLELGQFHHFTYVYVDILFRDFPILSSLLPILFSRHLSVDATFRRIRPI